MYLYIMLSNSKGKYEFIFFQQQRIYELGCDRKR